MHYSMTRLEREAAEYQRGLRTHCELVWDAWITATEDSRGLTDRVAVLSAHLSASAFGAVQLAARCLLETSDADFEGFIPYRFGVTDSGMESRPEFVPRTFIDRLAAEVQHV